MGISGFTGYQVIQSLKRAYPHLSDTLVKAQVAGYTGRQIVGMMKQMKGQKVNDDDFFDHSTTEHEKTGELDKRNKRQAINQALSLMGATGAAAGITLGAYQYLKSNATNPNMTILPALGKGGRRTAPQLPSKTVNVANKQLANQQKQLTYVPGTGQQAQQGQVPQISGPQPTQGPPPQAQLPGRSPPIGLPEPEYSKSVDIVKNLGNNTIFDNIVKQGFDPIMTSSVIRSIMKDTDRRSLGILDKVPGGLDKVVEDYTQYFQQKKQQEQYSAAVPKQQDNRVEFREPPGVLRMQGPQGQPQQAPPQVQQPQQQEQQQVAQAQQPQQIGPGRQRLQGLMDKLKQARGDNTITPVQQAAPAPQMQEPVAPREQPLSTVPSYPVLPPAPANFPEPKRAEKAVEKPKAKKKTKTQKEKLDISKSILSDHEKKLSKAKEKYDKILQIESKIREIESKKDFGVSASLVAEGRNVPASKRPGNIKKQNQIHKLQDEQRRLFDKIEQETEGFSKEVKDLIHDEFFHGRYGNKNYKPKIEKILNMLKNE